MQCIIYHILTRGKHPLPENNDHISQYTPFFENDRTWDFAHDRLQCDSFDDLGRLKANYNTNHHEKLHHHVFNTHIPFALLPQSSSVKCIYVMRQGKDAATSFYHHLSNQADADQYTGSFSQFLSEFLSGSLPYGAWVDHVHDYLSAAKGQHILVVQYEDMIANLANEVRRIVDYLELPYTDTDIQTILPFMSFQYMKENKDCFSPVSVPWTPGFDFIRKGVPGDNKAIFSEADHELYAKTVQERIKQLQEVSDGNADWVEKYPSIL